MARRRLPLVVVLAGGTALTLADAMADIVAPWLALEAGGPALAGFVAAAALLPAIPASLIGGWLADRRAAKPFFLFGAAAVVAVALILAAALAGGWLTPAVLLTVVAFGASLDEPVATVHESRLPVLAAMADAPLHRVNSIDDLAGTAAIIAGPALAAGVTAVAGLHGALLCIAAVGALAAVFYLAAPRLPPADAQKHGTVDLLHGLRRVAADRSLRGLAIGAAVAIAAFVAVEGVLLPVLVKRTGGDIADIALFVLPAAIGAGATAILYAWKGAAWPVGRLMRIGLAGFGVALIGLAAAYLLAPAWSPLALGLCGAVVGAAFGPVSPAATTAFQTRTSATERGAVIGAATALSLAAAPFASMASGLALSLWDPIPCLIATGALVLIVGVLMSVPEPNR